MSDDEDERGAEEGNIEIFLRIKPIANPSKKVEYDLAEGKARPRGARRANAQRSLPCHAPRCCRAARAAPRAAPRAATWPAAASRALRGCALRVVTWPGCSARLCEPGLTARRLRRPRRRLSSRCRATKPGASSTTRASGACHSAPPARCPAATQPLTPPALCAPPPQLRLCIQRHLGPRSQAGASLSRAQRHFLDSPPAGAHTLQFLRCRAAF